MATTAIDRDYGTGTYDALCALTELADALGIDEPERPEQRLAMLDADANLRDTAARWILHEQVHPGSGALDIARCLAQRDERDRLPRWRAAAAEYAQLLGEGSDEAAYAAWLVRELEDGIRAVREADRD